MRSPGEFLMTTPLWIPSADRLKRAHIERFRQQVETTHGPMSTPEALWRWSIEQREAFWETLWDFAEIRGHRGVRTLENGSSMLDSRWFPDARLNFAENLLVRRDDTAAIVARTESGARHSVTWRELYDETSRWRQGLDALGVEPGDRVAAWLPNGVEAVFAMLAATSLGATFTSCSPDFGASGVIDRFSQVEPRVLIGVEAYEYGGKRHDVLAKLAEAQRALPSVEATVVVPAGPEPLALGHLRNAASSEDFLAPYTASKIEFAQLPFDHPLYILYSSGTTGRPKCIVHGAGGTLLQHRKEHLLHTDLHPGDGFFYFTTLGWMMWNWLVSGLASEATIQLFDGSPFHPTPSALFDLAEQERTTIFGTSAKFIDAARNEELAPKTSHDLSGLRSLLSTGSPLSPESFDWLYDNVRDDLHVASISGGTDIVSCFLLGNPTAPVYRGELQAPGLAMAVDVFDLNGKPSDDTGELVCTRSFPAMPVGFWNDPEQRRYRAAYFERFENVWCHGDFVARTPHGGFVVQGRSDAVLNPGGVRIGTAEIYRQVEGLDEVEEAIAVGQNWENDVRVVLFVKLRPGHHLNEDLTREIRTRIRNHASPRHVPAHILEVSDIPRTRSGKIVELAVRDVIHGRAIANVEALANPEALEHFRDRAELGTARRVHTNAGAAMRLKG